MQHFGLKCIRAAEIKKLHERELAEANVWGGNILCCSTICMK
ncbi:hypothetical protein PSE_0371 [Pseudovibrio sp. FO-BEG1]|nr:hypothetical protein PSE_0371 [Pseudovibrio sp. FO-BEG1]